MFDTGVMNNLFFILKMWHKYVVRNLNIVSSCFNQHISFAVTAFNDYQIIVCLANDFTTLTT